MDDVDPAQNPFEQIRRALSGELGENNGQTISNEDVLSVARQVKSAASVAANLTSLLFGEPVPKGKEFFEKLHAVEYRLGARASAYELAGAIWAYIMASFTVTEQTSVLEVMLAPETGVLFFLSLRILPNVIETSALPSDFLTPWFLRLRARIGNDQAQQGYWDSLKSWSFNSPSEAFAGLIQLLDGDLDEDGICIAAALLGSLRVTWERTTPNDAGLEWERRLASNPDPNRRLIRYRSWVNTAWIRGLSQAEFSSCLNAMSTGADLEHREAFNFLRCLLGTQNIDVQSREIGIEWLTANAKTDTDDLSKHWTMDIIHQLVQRFPTGPSDLQRFCRLLAAISPISEKYLGTWKEIEYLLVHFINKDPTAFEALFLTLADADTKTLIAMIKTPRRFEYLISQIHQSPNRHFFAPYLFALARNRRELGFTLFEEAPFAEFPADFLSTKNDDEIGLALLQFRLHHFSPENIFRFLSALRVRVESGSERLIKFYGEELVYYMKSLPGACLGGFKPIAQESIVVRDAIERAEAYSVALSKCYRSPINSMEIPGLRRAFESRATRQQNEMHAKSEELSTFRGLFNTTYLIYNTDRFCYCPDGVVGEVSPMKTFSVQIEMPRLPLIDPEGYIFWKRTALNDIAALVEHLSKQEKHT